MFTSLLHYFTCHCCDSNNVAVITYHYIIIMSLLQIKTPVLTSFLPVITVIADQNYVSTVIIDQ